MTAKEFEEKHSVGDNSSYYYKKNWLHLFPKNDIHNYDNASLYLTYIEDLRLAVQKVMSDKKAMNIVEFFSGSNAPEQACIYVTRLYMSQERRSIRQTVINRYEAILTKFGVDYEVMKPKYIGL